ncbi:MAG: hypothetical protein ACRCYR_14155 [Phycicoccus sp.]
MIAKTREPSKTSRSIGCALVAAVLILAGLYSPVTLLPAAAVGVGGAPAVVASTPPGGSGGLYDPGWGNDAATVRAQERAEQGEERAAKNANSRGGGTTPAAATVDPYEYRLSIACGAGRAARPDGSDDSGNCQWALTACQFRDPPSDGPLYILWQRRTDAGPDAGWIYSGEYCRLDTLPAAAPPPPAIPSMAQIRAAFLRLPFAKPTVTIQPVGGRTLVNLPTYYQATWPNDRNLQPGEVSAAVKLLSWTVQFEVAVQDYDFHFGDGETSGPTLDPGGPYPDGGITHTYQQATLAKVAVQTRLTGRFRANGGDWTDLDATADLQGEPVTTLDVREARARLVTP